MLNVFSVELKERHGTIERRHEERRGVRTTERRKGLSANRQIAESSLLEFLDFSGMGKLRS